MNRQNRVFALAAVLLSALALSGCATSIADMPLSGTPADAPPRSKEAAPFLPVNELPPERDETTMNPAQRAKIQAELIAARDRQASATAAKNAAENAVENAPETTAAK